MRHLTGDLEKSDENTPVVATLIKDGSNGRLCQLYQDGLTDQKLPGSGCFRRFVRHAGTGLEVPGRQICEI